MKSKKPPPSTRYDQIINKTLQVTILYENEELIAFNDPEPRAPVHIVVVSKAEPKIISLNNCVDDHEEHLGKLWFRLIMLARSHSLKGYRIVLNVGPQGGQEGDHLCLHLLGGRKMKWPPG